MEHECEWIKVTQKNIQHNMFPGVSQQTFTFMKVYFKQTKTAKFELQVEHNSIQLTVAVKA
jgi:hypothetical protein